MISCWAWQADILCQVSRLNSFIRANMRPSGRDGAGVQAWLRLQEWSRGKIEGWENMPADLNHYNLIPTSTLMIFRGLFYISLSLRQFKFRGKQDTIRAAIGSIVGYIIHARKSGLLWRMFTAPVKCLFACVAHTRLDDLERVELR